MHADDQHGSPVHAFIPVYLLRMRGSKHRGSHLSGFNYTVNDPDVPNILGQYFMLNGTDYARQTRAINAIDNETIRENDFNEIRRIVCYNQSIYDDIRLEDDEWLGLTLSVDRASVVTNVRPMYDQAAIMIQDNDSQLYCQMLH